jgi:glutamate-ammonia-ligase adenylyltransferase
MGKLGSRELTAGSDVDLILLYDHDEGAEESDGDKPLAPSHYYARLTQRLIAAVSAPTAEGVLYELDLRLRPSGNKGPVATHIDAFRKYQREEAWTWEHMALTRARPIAGGKALCERVEAEVADILARPRDARKVLADAAEMRAVLAEEKPPRDIWDLKLIPGGQIDLEFIAQCAWLTDAILPDVWPPTSIGDALARLDPEFCDAQARDELVAAYALYLTLTQIVRLCLTGPLDPKDVPPGLADLLLRSTDLPDLSVLEAHIGETAARIEAHFAALVKGRAG